MLFISQMNPIYPICSVFCPPRNPIIKCAHTHSLFGPRSVHLYAAYSCGISDMKNGCPWVSTLLYISPEGCTIDLDRAQLFGFFSTPSPLSSVQNKCQCHSLSQTKCNQRHKSVMRPTGSATCASLCATGAGGAGTRLLPLLVKHCPLVARLNTDAHRLRRQNVGFIHYFLRCN